MTLTLTNQPTVEEVLSEAAPELPDADLKEEHLTNYVGFFVQTKDKCDYYIGLGLIKANEQWAQHGGGDGKGSPGRFSAWCDNNKSLVSSRQEAYRLMNWAKGCNVQNLDNAPEVIQQLQASLSKGARTELIKTEPIVQEAVINHVKETNESLTAKQIAELQEELERLRVDNAALTEAVEITLQTPQAPDLESLVEERFEGERKALQEKLSKANEEAKEAKTLKREVAKLKKEMEEINARPPLKVVDAPTPEDDKETAEKRENVVAMFERYLLTQCGDWRQGISRYHEFRPQMTPQGVEILDRVMKNIHVINLQYLDDNGDPKDTTIPTLDV